jgi:hypothetical protein
MGAVLGIAGFAALIILVLIGRHGMIREYDRRVEDWARAKNLTLMRVDREDRLLSQNLPPVWRVRVRTASGDTRDALLRGGWSIHEPVEVEWAEPGKSVFR